MIGSGTGFSGHALARQLLHAVAAAERGVTFCAFLVLIGVVFLDVLSRELTGAGLHWAGQAGVYANVVIVMLGLGVASAGGAHLRPRFADSWLPAAWAPVLLRLQHLVMALFCLGFAVLAAGIVVETRQLGELSPVLGNPVWPIQLVVPLAFLAAVFRHGLYALYPALAPGEAGQPSGEQGPLPTHGRDLSP